MLNRDATLAKIEQLPDSLLAKVSDFADLLIEEHDHKEVTPSAEGSLSQAWNNWFESLETSTNPPEQSLDYQQLLLEKYRKQGLEL